MLYNSIVAAVAAPVCLVAMPFIFGVPPLFRPRFEDREDEPRAPPPPHSWRGVSFRFFSSLGASPGCLASADAKARREASQGADDATVPVVAGAWAATVAWVVGYPADVLKTRILGSPQSMSLTQASRDLLSKEPPGVISSVRALYRGLGLKLLRAVPSSAVNFSVYEWTKRKLERVV